MINLVLVPRSLAVELEFQQIDIGLSLLRADMMSVTIIVVTEWLAFGEFSSYDCNGC